MTKEGYIYILLRSDFIEKQKYIYKIGETERFPPHKRLWDYPYGSVFLTLIKTLQPLQYEKKLKERLSNSNKVCCVKEIGIEYYEGSLQEIIDIITDLYPIFNQDNALQSIVINEEYLLRLNRVHYLVNYDPSFFDPIFQHKMCNTSTDCIPSEKIYESYNQFLRWHSVGFPDNYVIRHGMSSIKPNKKICYHVLQQTSI